MLRKLTISIIFCLLLVVLSQEALALTESTQIIEADKVQSMGFQGEGQTVCVIDSGINYTHPALGGCTQAQFLGGTCSKVIGGYDFYNNDKDPMDDAGHGTHVAGIVASEDATYKGVAPNSKLVALKVCNSSSKDGCSYGAIKKAIEWCVGNASVYNISIITISIGDKNANIGYCDDFSNENKNITKAINNAIAQNIIVTAASGNERSYLGINAPACIQNATSVGATYDYPGTWGELNIDFSEFEFGLISTSICNEWTAKDRIACFGNRYKNLDVLAPGARITSTVISGSFEVMSGIFGAPSVSVEKPRNYTLSIPSLSVGQESEFVLVFNNTESENRKIAVQWDFEEFDADLSHHVKNTIPAKKTKQYTYTVTPSVPGLHMLHIDISEDGTVLYHIDRVVMVNDDYTDL